MRRSKCIRPVCLLVFVAVAAWGEPLRFQETLACALDLSAQHQPAAAEEVLTGLLEDTERERPGDPRIGVILNNLASTYQDEGRYLEAEKAYLRSIAAMERSLGPEDPLLVKAGLVNLASLYLEINEPSKARPLLERGLRVAERNPAVDPEAHSTILADLASVEANRGHYEEADGLLERALAVQSRNSGPDSVEAAAVLNNLATVTVWRKDLPGALRYARRAVSIMEGHGAEAPAQLSRSLLNLGMVEQKMGSAGEAERDLKRALAVAESAYGPDHPLVGSVLAGYAALLREQGHKRQAKPMAERARAILARSREQSHLGLILDAGTLVAGNGR
jgi:tetratricopeptide (TPR) repeat protein